MGASWLAPRTWSVVAGVLSLLCLEPCRLSLWLKPSGCSLVSGGLWLEPGGWKVVAGALWLESGGVLWLAPDVKHINSPGQRPAACQRTGQLNTSP